MADFPEVKILIDRLVTAWNAGDGTMYGSAFTHDCDYITFNGERIRGRIAVAESHAELFRTHLKDSKLIFEQVDMRAVGDTILVHGVGNSLLKGQTKPSKSRRSIQTLVATRINNEWLFSAFHNTRIFELTLFRVLLMKFGI